MSLDKLCPDPARVAQLMSGELSAEEINTICDHVSGCTKCTTILRNLPEDLNLLRPLSENQSSWLDDPADREVVNILIDHWRDRSVEMGDSSASHPQYEWPLGHSDDLNDDWPNQYKPNIDELLKRVLRAPAVGNELGFLGPYRILSVLGTGGMGIVLEAEDASLDRRVAIKAMHPSLLDRPEHKRRFLREARAVASIDHDNIVPIHHVGEDNGIPYFVMPLLKGESLQTRLRHEVPLSIKQDLNIGHQIATGIAAAHALGLVHRDIKPGNIFLEDRGQQVPRVRLLDFGLSRHDDDDSHLTKTGSVAGTPAFMSPEQARGELTDARGDLFSFGSVLYYMFAGQPPFTGRNSAAIMHAIISHQPQSLDVLQPSLPLGLSALVDMLLEKDPDKRVQRAQEAADTLDKIRNEYSSSLEDVYTSDAHETTRIAPVVSPALLDTPKSTGQRRIGILAGIAIAILGLAAAMWILNVQTPHGTIVLKADPQAITGATIFVDQQQKITLGLGSASGDVTLEVDPGSHQLRVTKPGFEIFTRQFTLLTDDRQEIEVRLDPSDSAKAATAATPPSPNSTVNVTPKSQPAPLFRDGPFPGLVPAPKSILGLRRWQIETQPLRGDIFAVAWDRDDRRVACGSPTGNVRIIDAKTSKTLSIFPAHIGSIWAIDWSPVDDAVVTAGDDGAVRLFDSQGNLIRELGSHSGTARCVAFSRDGSWIASGGFDAQVRLWRASGEAGPVLNGHSSQIDGIAWHPSGKKIASASLDGTIRIWDLSGTWQTSGIAGQLLNGHLGGVLGISWSFDGQTLASAGVDGSVVLWNADGKQRAVLSGHANAVTAIACNDSGLIATSSDDKTVRLWKPDGTSLATQKINTTRINDLTWSRDGNRLAIATGDQGIRFLNASGDWDGAIEVDSIAMRSIALSSSGELAIVGDAGYVAIWNVDGTLKTRLVGQTGRVRSVTWSPNGNSLITASHEDLIRIWDVSNQQSKTLNGTAPAAWNPALDEIAWISGAEVHIRPNDANEVILRGHTSQVVQLAWNASGSQIATADTIGEIRVWDRDGTPHGIIKADPPVAALAWHPNGTMLTTGSLANGSITLWGLDGNLNKSWKAHSKAVIALAWDTAGDRLLSSSFDQNVRIWNQAGEAIDRLPDPMAICTAVVWDQPRNRIATAHIDGSVCFWDAATYQPISKSVIFSDDNWVRFDSQGIAASSNPAIADDRLTTITENESGHVSSIKPSKFGERYK